MVVCHVTYMYARYMYLLCDNCRQQWPKLSLIAACKLTIRKTDIVVKVQIKGPKPYDKKGGIISKRILPAVNFRSLSLSLHTFYLINIVFWEQIFLRKQGKSTPNDLQDHHVLVVDVVIMTSQCRCTRALSQPHVAKHDNHVPETPLIGTRTVCHVDAMDCRMAKSYGQKH